MDVIAHFITIAFLDGAGDGVVVQAIHADGEILVAHDADDVSDLSRNRCVERPPHDGVHRAARFERNELKAEIVALGTGADRGRGGFGILEVKWCLAAS